MAGSEQSCEEGEGKEPELTDSYNANFAPIWPVVRGRVLKADKAGVRKVFL